MPVRRDRKESKEKENVVFSSKIRNESAERPGKTVEQRGQRGREAGCQEEYGSRASFLSGRPRRGQGVTEPGRKLGHAGVCP